MTLAERLSEYVRACFTGIWITTFEPDNALTEIARLCRQNHWALASWDIDRGMSIPGQATEGGAITSATDPLAAIHALGALTTPDGTAILVLRNAHRFLNSAEVMQALDTQLSAGKQSRTFVIVLAPVVQIPIELEKLFVVLDHELPGRDQIAAIARGVATEPGELPDGDTFDAVIDAAAGLTRVEAENAFSLSLVRHGRLAPSVLWEIKSGTLKKSGLLTLHRGGETFAELGGLDGLKPFCSRALRPSSAHSWDRARRTFARRCGRLMRCRPVSRCSTRWRRRFRASPPAARPIRVCRRGCSPVFSAGSTIAKAMPSSSARRMMFRNFPRSSREANGSMRPSFLTCPPRARRKRVESRSGAVA
jgi:hypothetical protein